MIGPELLHADIAELSGGIRARRISPVELAEAFLQRIRRFAPELNAFETVAADEALLQARLAEGDLRAGHWRGALHGIPWAAKDLLATAGLRTTWGAAPLQEQAFDHDATVVTRLREAGAVLLGKTAMIELAGGLGYRFADASLSGPARNPWNREHWTGGSSSGSGAAVAAGLATFALGTETWGSILCPSAFCGITGLRPTYGRVSRAGAMACAWTFDKVGPMARSAADCRAVLQAIAGADPDDPSSSAEPVELRSRRVEPARLRVALFPFDAAAKGAETEAHAAYEAALAELRAAGFVLETVTLPDLPAAEVASVLIMIEAVSSFERLFANGDVRRLRDACAPFQREIAADVSGTDVVRAGRIRRRLQERMADFFAAHDVLVAPNFLSTAPRLDADLNQALPYGDPVGAIGNACGLPALALPCGFGRGHLPVGFQLVGPPWSEGLLLDLGELYQRRTRWHDERPPLD